MAEFRFSPDTTLIILSTKIETPNGIAYANLVLDTGATYCMLPTKLADAVGLKIDKRRTVKTTTASRNEKSVLVTIPKMSVLGESVENVDCIVRNLPAGATVDGLLGLSFLKHFELVLNFKLGKLIFTPS